MESSGQRFARRTDARLRGIERACSAVSAFMLAAIMVVVVADVGFRYLLNAPLVWSFDLITLYLTVGLFFFAVSDTLEDNSHVWVDVVVARVSPRVAHAFYAIGFAVSWLAFVGIGWMALQRAYVSFVNSEVTAGVLKMPVWVSSAFVAVGVGVLLLRLAYRTFAHAASATTGTRFIALPGSHLVHTGTE